MLVFQQERHVIDHGDQWRQVRDRRKEFERLVEDVLERVHRDGDARLADARLSLAALLGMVNHTAQWYRPRGRLSAAEIADGYVALIVAALSTLRPRRGLDLARERVDVVDALMAAAVDEERRRAGDAAGVGALDVLGDAPRVTAMAEVVGEARDVELQRRGVTVDV